MGKKPTPKPHAIKQREADQRQARIILEKVASESETVGTSSMTRAANRAVEHFSGTENETDDHIEILGKRIGRVLSLIAFIALAVYLAFTYVLK